MEFLELCWSPATPRFPVTRPALGRSGTGAAGYPVQFSRISASRGTREPRGQGCALQGGVLV